MKQRVFTRVVTSQAVAAALVGVIACELLAVTLVLDVFPEGMLGAVLPGALVALTNDERSSSGIPTLAVNELLTEAAEAKAADMAAKGYFSHMSPDGTIPWAWIDRVGYEYRYAGENLAVNFNESADVSAAWKASPSHWKNIINERFTEVGIAVAEGTYKGRPASYVVQFFASPRAEGDVLGASASSLQSFASRLASSPRLYLDRTFLSLLAFVLAALLLALFVKFRLRQTELLANGVLVSAAFAGIFMVGSAFTLSERLVPSELSFASTFSSVEEYVAP